MKTDKLYNLITIISMITMPAAAAINFGDAAFDALNGRTHIALAIIGGVFTGIGFETIGIVAGHRAVGFYSNKDRRWLAAGLALVAYIVIGVWEMWYIPFARFVPILSGLVYVLAGLQSEAESENVQDNERLAWEREQAAKDKELERELKRQEQADKTAVKLARVEAKTVTKPADTSGHLSGQFPGDFRLLTVEQKDAINDMTSGEIAQMADISDRTARRWKEKVAANGYHNGVTK